MFNCVFVALIVSNKVLRFKIDKVRVTPMRDVFNKIESPTWDTFFKNGILQLAKTDKFYRQSQDEHILVKGMKVMCYGGYSKRLKNLPILPVYQSLSALIVIPLNPIVFATVLNNLEFLSKYFAILVVDYNNKNAMRERDPVWKPYMTTVKERYHKKIVKTISVDTVRSACSSHFGKECVDTWNAFVERWRAHAGAVRDTLVKANHLVLIRIGAPHMDPTLESNGAILDTGGLLIPIESHCDPCADVVETPKRGKTGKKARRRNKQC